jgi:hypothetical protein
MFSLSVKKEILFFSLQPSRKLRASLLPLCPASIRHFTEMLLEVHCAASGYVSQREIALPSETYTPSDPEK